MRDVDVERVRLGSALTLMKDHLEPYLWSKHKRTRSVQADHTRWEAFSLAYRQVEEVLQTLNESDEEAFGRLARKLLEDDGANDSTAQMLTDLIYHELGELEQEAADASET